MYIAKLLIIHLLSLLIYLKHYVMKHLAILLTIFIITGMLSSCDKFGGKAKVEELTVNNETLKKRIREDSIMHLQELNMLREQYEREIEELKKSTELPKQVKGYFVVVGSFKNPANAENHAREIKSKGYEGAIVDGPNQFTLVTSGSYSNLKDAIEGYTHARNNIISTAWVYFKK